MLHSSAVYIACCFDHHHPMAASRNVRRHHHPYCNGGLHCHHQNRRGAMITHFLSILVHRYFAYRACLSLPSSLLPTTASASFSGRHGCHDMATAMNIVIRVIVIIFVTTIIAAYLPLPSSVASSSSSSSRSFSSSPVMLIYHHPHGCSCYLRCFCL